MKERRNSIFPVFEVRLSETNITGRFTNTILSLLFFVETGSAILLDLKIIIHWKIKVMTLSNASISASKAFVFHFVLLTVQSITAFYIS